MHQSRSSLLVPDTDRSMIRAAVIAAVLTVVCIAAIDQPFARWIATRDTAPAIWNRGIAVLEYLGMIEPWKWLGVCVLVAGTLATLVVPRIHRYAPALMLITLTHVLARNVMLWGKFATGRLRPSEWLARGGTGPTFFHDDGWSFPSGHVVLFGSLALPIAMVWPRTRVPMFAIVAFAMIARVAVDAHFLSDVLAGLAVTAAVAALCARLVRRASSSQTPPASP